MNRNWLLIALASAPNGVLTPVQVQKAMFLMGAEARNIVGDSFYKFEPYDYGPFNPLIYSDLETLEREGDLIIDNIGSRNLRTYVITPVGLARAEQLKNAQDPKGVAFLKRVVEWVAALSFPDLVRAIYEKYPDYKVNSVFKH